MIDTMAPSGPNPGRVRFFQDMAMAMQFMALYHSLSEESQREMMEGVKAFSAELYNKPQEAGK